MPINNTLRNNVIVLASVSLLIASSVLAWVMFTPKPTIVTDLTAFTPRVYEEDTFLIMTPTTPLGVGDSYIYQIDGHGNLLESFAIQDDDFMSFFSNQNIHTPNVLNVALLGAVLRTYLLDYNLQTNTFEKIDLPYKHDTSGVSHAGYYGKTRIFETIASHITGDIDDTISVDSIDWPHPIDSLCLVASRKCVENNKSTLTQSRKLIAFDNGNLMTIRIRENYNIGPDGIYEEILDLYDNQLNHIKTGIVSDWNMDGRHQIFFHDNKLVLIPDFKLPSPIDAKYYVIDENLNIKAIPYPNDIAFRFDRENVLQISDNTFVFTTFTTTDEEETGQLRAITFNGDAFTIQDLTSLYADHKTKKIKLYSVDYKKNEFYFVTQDKQWKNQKAFIVDSANFNHFRELPLPDVVKNRAYIDLIVPVSQVT